MARPDAAAGVGLRLLNRKDLLASYGLGRWAISNHLNGQAVCGAIIDGRYESMVNPRVWGDGDPEGVRQRGRGDEDHGSGRSLVGVHTVVGFTGSAIWHYVAMFPSVADAPMLSWPASGSWLRLRKIIIGG